jgi:RNA polymerase sigma-70 factor (ECF subfamily)
MISEMGLSSGAVSDQPAEAFSTARLVAGARAGQAEAREQLFQRCLAPLRRFAHGRLPPGLRDTAETDDLVQLTLLRALGNLHHLESLGRGAFLGYLRTIMLNAVREHLRARERRPHHTADFEQAAAAPDSALGHAIGVQTLDAFEQALSRLTPLRRDAVVLRLEFDLSFAEIALELNLASADAARMQVSRGLREIAELMP